MTSKFILKAHIAAIILLLHANSYAQTTAPSHEYTDSSPPEGGTLQEIHVLGTAEEELRQALGVSIITSTDIERRPPVNDISEVLRTMPGVNLTGNSSTGQRGNNRQIDIRGMGPENTLILIDGRPVSSRNSVRFGWRGERDSRGDTNWVAPSEIERIEVIRGPAAARYGSGAAGGVVNIITKPNTDTFSGSITLFTNQPEHSSEGDTRRMTFALSGPLTDRLSFRISGNINKTDADEPGINDNYAIGTYTPAGREGVRNRDITANLRWNLLPGHTLDLDASYSRQGNIYTGDTQNNNTNKIVQANLGNETNRLYRQNYALTYNGEYDFGTVMSYFQYSNTRNTRINEGLAGATEGAFSTTDLGFSTNTLDDYIAHLEANMPLTTAGFSHVLTIGTEWSRSELDDNNSMKQGFGGGVIPGMQASNRSTNTSANTWSFFIEDNLELTDRMILTPGLRFDHHSVSGSNWSPSLNLSYYMTDNFTIKAGIARAYKAPNLYQSNENYLLYSRGNGCWGITGTGCYLLGNSDLKAETSTNKELGIEYRTANNFLAGITYFRNDYHDKIEAGITPIGNTGTATVNTNIYQWVNIPRAVVEGLEGTLNIPLTPELNWSNNFTYMIRSENKLTGDRLSIIPEYTINSTLDWNIRHDWSMQATLTYYGRQKPARFDYKGNPVTGYAATVRGSYALFGVGTTYQVNNNLSFTAGVSNLFDKRLFRRGNSTSAGAETYNEPGRAYYVLLTMSF